MDRIVDFFRFLLGRRRGPVLILGALNFFEKIERDLVRGMSHIDTDIEARKQRIAEEQQEIGALTQIRATASSALTQVVKLTGGAEKH